LLLQEPDEVEFYDKKDLHDLASLSLSELELEKVRGLKDYWIIIDNALLLLWIHLAKYLSRYVSFSTRFYYYFLKKLFS
jgi:hypothetical protein